MVPRIPQAWAYDWDCTCGGGYRTGSGEDIIKNWPDSTNRPVVMRKNTVISEPALAFPVRIDYLVAAALAIQQAISSIPQGDRKDPSTYISNLSDVALKEFLKPHITSVYEDAQDDPTNYMDDYVDSPDGTEVDDDDSADDEDASDNEEDPDFDPYFTMFPDDKIPIDDAGRIADRKSRGMHSIRNFREIHDALHVAQLSTSDERLAARDGEYTAFEDQFHDDNCRQRTDQHDRRSRTHPHMDGTRRQWSTYNQANESEDLDDRVGCRAYDRDYWSQLASEYASWEPDPDEDIDPSEAKKVQMVHEFNLWGRTIGLDRNSIWLRHNVIDVSRCRSFVFHR